MYCINGIRAKSSVAMHVPNPQSLLFVRAVCTSPRDLQFESCIETLPAQEVGVGRLSCKARVWKCREHSVQRRKRADWAVIFRPRRIFFFLKSLLSVLSPRFSAHFSSLMTSLMIAFIISVVSSSQSLLSSALSPFVSPTCPFLRQSIAFYSSCFVFTSVLVIFISAGFLKVFIHHDLLVSPLLRYLRHQRVLWR